MNKYNEFMGHIRVDDEMHRRVMNAVSAALENEENGKETETVTELPVSRKTGIPITKILSIAAAVILVAGGTLFFVRRFLEPAKSAKSANVQMVNNAETRINEEIDAALGGDSHGGNKTYFKAPTKAAEESPDAGNKTISVGRSKNADTAIAGSKSTVETDEDSKTEAETEATTRPAAVDDEDRNLYVHNPKAPSYSAIANKSFKDYLPFKVKTIGSSTFGEQKISATVYTGEKGEKMILLSAKAGTDICKAYYPKFRGIPVLLQTEGGQQFYGVDTSAGKKEQVGSSGPFDAVYWTKDKTTYMLVFNTKTDAAVFVSLMDKI